MAKVATLDIVKHDGEVYVKEARKAEVGEKILVINAEVTAGKYDNGDILTVDEIGGIGLPIANGQSLFHREYNVLVPLKPGARVTVDGVEYEVIGDGSEARVGDFVAFTEPLTDVDTGDVFEVFEGEYMRSILDNAEDGRGVDNWEDETVTLRKVTQSNENKTKEGDEVTEVIAHKDVKYRKVERDVVVGDKILSLKDERDTHKGGVYVVIEIDGDGDPHYIDDIGDGWYMNGKSEYVVLEPIPQSIDERIADIERQLAELKAERAKQRVEGNPEQERLKVGEYAVVTCDKYSTGRKREDVNIGDVYVIKRDNGGDAPFRAEKLDGSDYHFFREEALRRATPEEVAEAKAALAEEQAKQAEQEKWAKIGRKVGEFKAGDIVECTGGLAAGKAGYGEVLAELKPREKYRVKYYSSHGICCEPINLISLVVPVEQRFDRQA